MDLLRNDKIWLRAPEPEDLERLYRWENDTACWNVGNTLAPYSRFLLKRYITEAHRDIYELKQLRLMIVLVASNETIGMIDLYDFDPHHRRAGIGLLIDPHFQGNGWASEAVDLLRQYAFSFLQLHQLYAHVPAINMKSRALFTRCGFEMTGMLKDWIVVGENYSDVLVMQSVNKNPRK